MPVAAAGAAGESNYADAANIVDDPLDKILPLDGALEISDDNLSPSSPQVAVCAGLDSASMPLLPTGASSVLLPELESSVARLLLQVLVSSIESGVVPPDPGSLVEGFLGSLLSILAPICWAPPGPLWASTFSIVAPSLVLRSELIDVVFRSLHMMADRPPLVAGCCRKFPMVQAVLVSFGSPDGYEWPP